MGRDPQDRRGLGPVEDRLRDWHVALQRLKAQKRDAWRAEADELLTFAPKLPPNSELLASRGRYKSSVFSRLTDPNAEHNAREHRLSQNMQSYVFLCANEDTDIIVENSRQAPFTEEVFSSANPLKTPKNGGLRERKASFGK